MSLYWGLNLHLPPVFGKRRHPQQNLLSISLSRTGYHRHGHKASLNYYSRFIGFESSLLFWTIATITMFVTISKPSSLWYLLFAEPINLRSNIPPRSFYKFECQTLESLVRTATANYFTSGVKLRLWQRSQQRIFVLWRILKKTMIAMIVKSSLDSSLFESRSIGEIWANCTCGGPWPFLWIVCFDEMSEALWNGDNCESGFR